jgi:capsular exopolysaccharide synthesis family protein
MSLIEAAVQKAKKLADGAAVKTPPEQARTVRLKSAPDAAPDAATVAARVAQARELPLAGLDDQIMERTGVLLRASDPAAQRGYRILRTRVQQRMQAQGWNSVAVTSPGQGEGKTLTSINLALALAKDVNTWVYLVDLDLQHPSVGQYLGMNFDRGLSDFLAGQATMEDIVFSLGVERLAVIPNGQVLNHSSDALASPRMHELYQALAAEQPRPIVIYDLPPLLLSDDVIKIAPLVDCMLLVVAEGATSRSQLELAKEVLHEMNLLGVVLNRTSERTESGYY